MKDFFIYTLIVLSSLLLAVIFMDITSMYPHYELRPAVVMKVTDDERGFIDHKKMTIVKFEDDFVSEVGGDKGEPGDKVLAYRQNGTISLFGIFGDRKIIGKKP